jgi:hypothetical protein
MTSTTDFADELWPEFLSQIPEIRQSQDPQTGRFGTQPFIITDQNALWPLAVAYAADRDDNPYCGEPALLEAILAGGDAIIAAQDANGMFEFRKKDNSTWGQIYMPWTYSRWIRTWGLIRDVMPADRRERWDAAISLGVDGMIATVFNGPIRNIPAHDAMAVFRASQILGRDDWRTVAVDYLHRVVDEQDPGGFWSEHFGPVLSYNFVYVDVLGVYYGMSKDPYVLPALERAADYHAHFTYPDGTGVETIDERNPYGGHQASVGVGFTFSPLGRGYLRRQLQLQRTLGGRPSADAIASIIAYGADGAAEPTPAEREQHLFVLGADDAMTVREGPWFACLSAYCCEPGPTRWIQDRQAFVSVFHDRTGLILSGSNTKLQPLWSTFTAGDVTLLQHTAGDEDPDFSLREGLAHLPATAALRPEQAAVDLTYGDAACAVQVEFDGDHATVSYALTSTSSLPVEAHAGFVAHVGEDWRTPDHRGLLDETPFTLSSPGWFEHHSWRIELPAGATVTWPVAPHNPYTKDGSSTIEEARLIVTLPLGTSPAQAQLRIQPTE